MKLMMMEMMAMSRLPWVCSVRREKDDGCVGGGRWWRCVGGVLYGEEEEDGFINRVRLGLVL